MTNATAVLSVCVIESCARAAPSLAATFAAAPVKKIVGRPPASRRTSICCQFTPRCMPVPSALLAASLAARSEEHTSELQSRENLVCRLLLEKKKKKKKKERDIRRHRNKCKQQTYQIRQ